MSNNKGDAALELICNPVYWDGHMFGDPHDKAPHPASPDIAFRYADFLRKRAPTVGHQIQCDRLNPGDVFDPADHEPGTLVAFGEEQLIAGAHLDEINVNTDYPYPRPLYVTHALGFERGKQNLWLSGKGITYARETYRGIVATNPNNKRQPFLYAFPAARIFPPDLILRRAYLRRMVRRTPPLIFTSSIIADRVQHVSGAAERDMQPHSPDGVEKISRIFGFEICSTPKKQSVSKRGFSFRALGSLLREV